MSTFKVGLPELKMRNPNRYIRTTNPAENPLKYWLGSELAKSVGGIQHVLRNRLVAGEITALYGLPKSGKTFIAILLALAAALDDIFWGQTFKNNGTNIIYFAAERVDQVTHRLLAAARRIGIWGVPANIIVVDAWSYKGLSDEEFVEQLAGFVAEKNPSLVIFDTYARLIINNEDKAADATGNIKILEKIISASQNPCAGLLVHHAGKEEGRKMRGSNALLAAVTTSWKVSKKENLYCLEMEDANAFEPCEPAYFEITTMEFPLAPDDNTRLSVGVAVPVAPPPPPKSQQTLILEAWSETNAAWQSIQDIRALLAATGHQMGDSTISRTLSKMVSAGEVEIRKVGKKNMYRVCNLN